MRHDETAGSARAHLVRLLQLAYSGELAADLAYAGHRDAVRDPAEKAEIETIRLEEVDHRARVGAMLAELGEPHDAKHERKMRRIGTLVAAFCRFGGWFGPMWGAARLERNNVGEYERAAGFAVDCGYAQFVPDLVDMSEVEWDHELYFRTKAKAHWLWRVFPKWDPPPPKSEIRRHLADVLDGGEGAASTHD